jgi:hypothetical protein
MTSLIRSTSILLFLVILTACITGNNSSCPISEPTWLLPPDDPAINNPPVYGYYFTNDDQSILASAWWTDEYEGYLHANENGIKVGWFRPEAARLQISGSRLDGWAPALEAHVPCCYPTRFQATGLTFPTEGCWEVTAKAEEKVLTFVVEVAP